jgi:hypothetical protein
MSFSNLSMAERSLNIIRKINRNPIRITALMLPSIPIISAMELVIFGKVAMRAIPPHTIILIESL